MTARSFPVCWTREFVAETVSTEAVHADRAVFLATHRPLRVLQSSWDSGKTARVVDEQQVFDDFIDRRPVGGVVLMPVLGESGTGKSHLVRWVWEHLSDTPQRRVVYLPKTGTNLPAVVRALLLDLEGPSFDEIRTRVSRTTERYDRERLPYELLARLAIAVRFHQSDTLDPAQRPLVKMLTSDKGLPALLNDYEYNRHLVRPDGVLSRLASEIQRGRQEGEHERPFGFTAEDLRPADIKSGDMGEAARRIFQQLLGLPELITCAAEVLNANLDKAVLRLADLGAGQLQQAMLDIRRELYGRGQEIVLLVEDFAVIQGVQGDLLDAVSEPGIRGGRQELATVRTLLAVTPGYYKDNIPETFRTRAMASVPYSYQLDVPIETDGGVDDQHLVDFVGRYLNAARLGADVLRSDINGDGVVPNACRTCTVQSRCHVAFGTTSDGFGLYPYSQRAVARAVRLSMPRDSIDFNPRRILGRVVRHVLDNYDSALRAGEFPSEAFRGEFAKDDRGDLSAAQADYLTRQDPEHARRIPLLELWGTGTVENLHEGIHEAFRLPRLPDEMVKAARERAPVSVDPTPAGAGTRDRDVAAAKLAVVDEWHHGGILSQAVANDLRQIIREAIVAHVNWGDLGLATPTEATRRSLLVDRRGNGVIIEGAYGDRDLDAPSAATVVLKRGPGTATLFRALLERKARGTWDFPGGPEQQRRFTRKLDEWGATMVDAVRADLGLDRPGTLQAAVEVSLLGARLLNLDGSQSHTTEKILDCLFNVAADRAAPDTPLYKDEQVRSETWTRAARRHAGARSAVVTQLRGIVGVAQGDGGEQLVDAETLRPLLAMVRTTWRETSGLDLPDWLGRPHKSLGAELQGAVEDQWERLQGLCREVEGYLGDDDPEEMISAVEEALSSAQQAVPGALALDPMQVKADMVRARSFPWKAVRQLAEEFADSNGESQGVETWARKFALGSVDRGPNMQEMLTFLRSYGKSLDAVRRRTEQQLSAQPESPVDELEQLLDQAERAVAIWSGADV
ncbi:hypothetical protein GCM10010464_04160 [Pseudonocardia yunnanensis]|uniref:Protein DpdH n=1 Tax=Pseudonocardia yunnanensis TaxID=58107 RepID=A0ABW4ETB2_9PSEU